MIPCGGFAKAWDKHLSPELGHNVFAADWESDWGMLQKRRLKVEQEGPDIEPSEPLVLEHGTQAEILMGLFIAVSAKLMDAMPMLRIIGVSRAGVENVDVAEATRRGILVFNVMGRNAHAVSDFAVGMMLAECRNIARAHHAIKNGQWRKTFVNSSSIPELNGKTVGLVGFGYIGRLMAKKLSGFDTRVIVYDPNISEDDIRAAGCFPAGLDDLFATADFISLHARLTDSNKEMVNSHLINLMKPTAYLVNTGRAGLVDQQALADALGKKQIMGAALDVFTDEPINPDSPFLKLDNVTLTTHIAGTTSDALANSPFLLAEDIAQFVNGGKPRFIVNKEVLENPDFVAWLAGL
jgi:D-3-phosphoglycerate dehydrogenase